MTDTPEKKTKKTPDWQRIRAEYRAGQLSIREIARQYDLSETAIRKKAKTEGWTRDLSSQVREKVRTDLVRSEVRTEKGSALTDDEIIEEAAARGVLIVRGHQKAIGEAMELFAVLMLELKEATRLREEIEEAIILETAEDKTDKRRARMLAAVSLGGRVSTLRDLSTAMKTYITLERQAFNLDDHGTDDCSHERALEELA